MNPLIVESIGVQSAIVLITEITYLIKKPDFCKACPINHVTGEYYTPLKLRPGHVLDVGEASGEDEIRSGEGFSGGSGRWLQNLHKSAGQNWATVSTLNVIGCHPPDNIFPGDIKWHATSRQDALSAVEYCKQHHMWPGVKKANRSRINAIGAQALQAITGRRGITLWRGSPLPMLGSNRPTVMPTIHPAALMRQAKMTSAVVSDLRKSLVLPPENYNLAPSLEDVRRFDARHFAFDFEWDHNGNITLCGLSDRFYSALVVPFRGEYIELLRSIFESAESLIGHNIINADMAWFDKLGWRLRPDVVIEDTMLKQHLVQPDYKHDLGFVASIFTNKVFWKGKGWEEEEDGEVTPAGQQWRTWDRPDALPKTLGGYGGCLSAGEAFALYNARDTDAEFQINTPLDTLLSRYELQHVYRHISVPIAFICRDLGERGLKLDTSHLTSIRADLDATIKDLEGKLPDGLRPYLVDKSCNLPAPDGTYRTKEKHCKGLGRKQPHEPARIIFEQPSNQPCPTCGKLINSGKMALAKTIKGTRQERVVPYNSPPQVQAYVESLTLKEVIDSKTGRKTTGKRARKIWAKDHPEFTLLGVLKQKITLRNNFAKTALVGSVEQGIPAQERMFFNLKVHGTSEGRLSSSGRREGIDLNIQNQPEAFRVIYVPDHPDWGFINIDISQGESWLTCWFAKDWERWEKLQDPDYDEHSELAAAIFNTPVNKKLAKADPLINAYRQIGKKTNHASGYGMGYKKFHEILTTEGYSHYSPSDAKEFLEAWRRMNPKVVEWQKQTIGQASQVGYLTNPFGRKRWFSHRDATQCLAFLPASTLADMVLRMMICHYPSRFMDSIQANGQEVFAELVKDWIMSIQVHDSLVFQGPWATKDEQIERSRGIMTQPFRELDGFRFRVDIKSSNVSWGDC